MVTDPVLGGKLECSIRLWMAAWGEGWRCGHRKFGVAELFQIDQQTIVGCNMLGKRVGLPPLQHAEGQNTLRFTGFRGFPDTQLIVLEFTSHYSKTIS